MERLRQAKMAAGKDKKIISRLCLKSSLSQQTKSAVILELKKFFSFPEIEGDFFFQSGFFHFSNSESYFQKYKTFFEVSVS